MVEETLTEGDEVEVEFTDYMTGHRNGRTTVTSTVTGVTGDIVYLANPYGDHEYPTLVVDPEDEVWARSESGKDGLAGTNADVTPA